MPDDPNGVQATAHAEMDGEGRITAVIVDTQGSGYSSAPGVVIRDGTIMDPITNAGAGATATATLNVLSVAHRRRRLRLHVRSGCGDHRRDRCGRRRDRHVGRRPRQRHGDQRDGRRLRLRQRRRHPQVRRRPPRALQPCRRDAPTAPGAKYIPLGVPEEKTYPDPRTPGASIKADEYEIALVQYRTQFNADLPPTLVRGYVQLETAANEAISQHFPLTNELVDGTKVPIVDGSGNPVLAVTPPQWLGPTIAATKNKPVRIVFHNLLPIGSDGNLYLPTDTTLMGSGVGPTPMPAPINDGTVTDEVRNPVCTDNPQSMDCYKQNRATLHLHGGLTPWISDGTPHQWITPAGEDTAWPQGVSVQDVPDMDAGKDARDGVQTFYYTNQQSARLMFYHDHAYGITRLNVYAGEAAGYLISDDTEKKLIDTGTIPGAADTIPLVVQDRTFVPQDTQLYDQTDAAGNVTSYGQDPTWDKTKWGSYGSFWYHHVYMPAQNPGDPSGMSAYGRWMYGPWFWPPASATPYMPIANPFHDPDCNLDDPATWQYQTDPFCEPEQIPGTPNISTGMEQFNDTPIVNGVAYPKVTLQPKTYRFRVLNAANDRFFNLQWYVADPRTGTLSEVALNPQELAAAQTDPNVFPTPDLTNSPGGPDWVQIGSEGGFLPAPTVVNGHQPITWITDPTRFDVGNVDLHSLVLGPAERADVIVDFSKYAGKTLIMYNDAPAAYPARVPSYDYYTGGPDLSPVGAPTILPGYGPNTRTVMQVTIAGTPAAPFDVKKLNAAFSHKANGSGVFESGQNPIIVGQAAYNTAYGTNFAKSGNCNAIGSTLQICDGFVRVNDTQVFGFNTLKKPTTKSTLPLQPKAIHDEMNATTFDEYGRMQATLGLEAQPPTPGLQNVTLYPYINPQTELIDGTNLPREMVVFDADGNVDHDVKITPVTTPADGQIADGTQIWRVTHNGVDTHPIHFHLYDVQVLNRVTWDNIIIQTEASELGWKDTVRMSPLQDTIVALRPVVPDLPWELPNAIRDLNPAMPTGSTVGFNNIDPQGIPTAPIVNQLVNFGWEYVYHCHILTHEEMDMMRPVTLALPPVKADGLASSIETIAGVQRVKLDWNDNSINETAFVVQKATNGGAWTNAYTVVSPLDQPNDHGTRTWTDPAPYDANVVVQYRVVAQNSVGYGLGFPAMTVQSTSRRADLGELRRSRQARVRTGASRRAPCKRSLPTVARRSRSRPTPGTTSDVLVDGVSNPVGRVVGATPSTTWSANHTISATFEANPTIASRRRTAARRGRALRRTTSPGRSIRR